ncbi:uncharacterized protein LOC134278744 [Saccostrea cucullata]|uniref:uncharacterized protein LOC134278744 n=1 Tax=Saccostrea cuccullata TaxID=36930 RepID=UPI002ED481FD
MKTMMATCMIFKLLFWSFLITVFMTDLNYGQSHLVTDTFSRQKETVLLKEILQLVKNQAEKMQTLERELTSMNDKLSKCLSISRSFPSGRHDEEQQDTTTSLISREKSTTLETNPTMQLTSASDIPIVKTEGETATRQDSLSTTDTATSAVMHTTDLTGTFIVSTKPISVFSGNRCQFLKNGCSHMMTQLPPTTEFDNRYIVPPFYGEWGTLIQVISERQSSINISVGSTVSMWHMQEKEFKNTEVTTDETTIIESTNPVLVTGFGMGSSNNDPYMTVMPGVHQYIDNYKIVIPDGYRDNYICVIIPEKSKNYLQINGIPIESNITVRLSSAVLDTIYSIYTFKVNSGAKVLSTTNNAAFGLIAYSHRHSDGYAFAGNYVLP